MLNIIIPLFNPFDSFYRCLNLEKTIESFPDDLVNVFVVELCYGDQKPKKFYKNHLVLNCDTVLWHKENLINLCVQTILPKEWSSFAWIDGDILFENNKWVNDALKLLETNDVLQLFSSCNFLNKENKKQKTQLGFINSVVNNLSEQGHAGYAWAMNRNFYDKIGGLYENAIMGGGDRWMCQAFIQKRNTQWLNEQPKGMIDDFQKFYNRCRETKFNFVFQDINHLFHGELNNRGYTTRHTVLKSVNFDPQIHLCKNQLGLLVPSLNFPKNLKKYIVDYFYSRKEN
jgi:hypothetical protein